MMSDRMSQLWLMHSDNINEFGHQSPQFPGQALRTYSAPTWGICTAVAVLTQFLVCAWRTGFRDTTVEIFRTTKGRFPLCVTFTFHIRSFRMVCVHTVRRVPSPSRTARDRRPAIISIKYAAHCHGMHFPLFVHY